MWKILLTLLLTLCAHAEFTKWQRQRSQHEQSIRRYEKVRAQRQLQKSGEVVGSKAMTDAEKKERKRQLNVIHSRQKRERRKAEAEEMKKQCVLLKQNNQILKRENAELLKLMETAYAILDRASDPWPTGHRPSGPGGG